MRAVCQKWLDSKYRRENVPMTSGLHHLTETSTLLSQSDYSLGGAETACRLQLHETKPEATWRTTVTARTSTPETDQPALVAIDLECFPAHDGVTAGRPRLICELVDALRPHDGLAPLTTRVLKVTAPQVETLIHVLCDPDRAMPVLVTGQPRTPDPLWSERLKKTWPKAAGNASLFLLSDHDAIETFRKAVGNHHFVAPGSVRTFLPDVDPAWPADGPRHRFISAARWSDPTDRIWHTPATAVKDLALDHALPTRLRTIPWPDPDKERNQQRRDTLARTSQPQPAGTTRPEAEVASLREEVEVLTGLLAEADSQLTQAAEAQKLADRTHTSLEDRFERTNSALDQEMADHLRTMSELERAENEVQVLRSRLWREGRHQDTIVTPPPAELPTDFSSLWNQAQTLELLLITADKDTALGLDDHQDSRTWAAKAWNALRALSSYAQHSSNGYNGSFLTFCRDQKPGARIYPVNQIAMGETQRTMAQWGDERLFPVPETLAPSGTVTMGAHMKITSKGSISPRVYFYDDVKGPTGKIIVGYIGPHLTNCKTT